MTRQISEIRIILIENPKFAQQQKKFPIFLYNPREFITLFKISRYLSLSGANNWKKTFLNSSPELGTM
jgi:hypothetical protein